jgi:hypothetical protein
MLSHEIRMASIAFGRHSEDIKPLIPAGASDTAALDAVFEAICRSGRDAPTAKLMLVPESLVENGDTPDSHAAMYRYLASVMEPWDGPAALAMTDGRWAVAGMDRNALRPLRYTRTADGLLIVGSESGMVVVPESTIVAKGRLGPGQMIAVDLDEGVVLEDRAVKDRIAGESDYASRIGEFLTIADLPPSETVVSFPRAELLRRQVAAGQTLEDLELILAPMVEGGKEAVGSMGDDTPLAVISDKPRLISQFFRQNFSQVTNPPIDSLRERHVMSLRTRFGNLANILDAEERREAVLVLDSPVLTGRGLAAAPVAFRPWRSGDRLHLPGRRRAGAAPRRDRPHPRRGGSGRAAGAIRAVPDRRGGGSGQGGHPRRPRRGCRPHAPGPPRLAFLCLRQRAHRRVPGHALLRGADRRRRHDGERLSVGSGDRRSPCARAVRRPHARSVPCPSPDRDRGRVAQDHEQDGDRGDLFLSRRVQLRSGGAQPGAGQRPVPRDAGENLGRGLCVAAFERDLAAPRRL